MTPLLRTALACTAIAATLSISPQLARDVSDSLGLTGGSSPLSRAFAPQLGDRSRHAGIAIADAGRPTTPDPAREKLLFSAAAAATMPLRRATKRA